VRRIAWAALLLLAPIAPARAENDIQVEVYVDRPRPASDETVRLVYKFSGSGVSGRISGPSPLPLKNLSLVGGPSSSNEMSFINGIVKHSLTLTYYLRPIGPGTAEVGETSWTLGDKTVKAPAYLLEAGPPRGNRAPAEEADAEDDPIASFFRGRDPRGIPRNASTGGTAEQRQPLIEYKATPDKTTAYVGEEIMVSYELITQADPQGLEYVDPPKFPGFWAEDLEKPERPTGHRDVYENRSVVRFTLLKKLVSGLAPGTLTIPPARIRTTVRMLPDQFGDPFSFLWRPQAVELSTKAITIKVLPIPGDKSFKGPVGRFDLSAKVDKTRVAVGEAVTLRVRIAGTGNLRTATEPPKVSIPNVRLYPPTTRSDPSRAKGQAFTEWDYVLVPSARGEIRIPPITLDVFDPVEKRVVAKTSGPIALVAEGGKETAANTEADTTMPLTPTAPPTASAPLRIAGPANPPLDLAHGTVTLPLWALAAVPGLLAVAGGSVLFLRRRRRGKEELLEALTPEPGETKERASGRIDRALRKWLVTRYGLAEAAPTAEILQALDAGDLSAGSRNEIGALLDDLDFLRFAPQLGDYDAKIREVRERAARLLPKLR
jgi:BatD DUF11 like domain